MPPKKRPREGPDLQKQDNNLGFTSWPIPQLLNQKNYYTEFLKRDDQSLSFRLQAEERRNQLAKAARDRDRALAQQAGYGQHSGYGQQASYEQPAPYDPANPGSGVGFYVPRGPDGRLMYSKEQLQAWYPEQQMALPSASHMSYAGQPQNSYPGQSPMPYPMQTQTPMPDQASMPPHMQFSTQMPTPTSVQYDNDATSESDFRPGSDGPLGSKVIVIHPGSQNLRIGLASDPLPKTVPMVIARKAQQNEYEEQGGDPRPKQRKVEGLAGQAGFEDWFVDAYATMTADLKGRLRNKGVRFVPNTREQAMAFNRKIQPDVIPEHNDINKIEWTEITSSSAPDFFVGTAALRIPDKSTPRYRLSWPLRYGVFNEKDYKDRHAICRDIVTIIEEALKTQLGLTQRREWKNYDCVVVVPDLYERDYVSTMLEIMFRDFGFSRVCLIQESVSASHGAGYSPCCIVDVGAHKTSICCVEDGMVVENSRVVLRYGSADVTEAFIKMMLTSDFPYADLNLRRRYDFLLAEELKQKFCTLAYVELAHGSRQFEFLLRAPDQDTRHYKFKCYDEVMLSSMGYYRPALFDTTDKLAGKRSLIDRSYDLYDGVPNDPVSSAQAHVLAICSPSAPAAPAADQVEDQDKATSKAPAPFAAITLKVPAIASIETSNSTNEHPETKGPLATSPPREGETPQPARNTPLEGAQDTVVVPSTNSLQDLINLAIQKDEILPCIPLDDAIAISVEHASANDERKMRDFYGGIIPIGGGSQTNGFRQFLEEELQNTVARFKKEIIVAPPPREIDPQVLVWKGASIFGKLAGTNETWISGLEWDRLGSRILAYKCLWTW